MSRHGKEEGIAKPTKTKRGGPSYTRNTLGLVNSFTLLFQNILH